MKGLDKKAPLTDEEQRAFQELYQTHQRRVYSTCLRMTRDISEAEDLTQEVFVHLFRALGSFRGESAFTTWLHRLTVNHVLMHFRKRKVRAERTTEGGELPFQVVAGSNDYKRMNIIERILLSEVIAKLPQGYRDALVLPLHKARRMLRALITQPGPKPSGTWA